MITAEPDRIWLRRFGNDEIDDRWHSHSHATEDVEYIKVPAGFDLAQELRTVLGWEKDRMGIMSAAVIHSVIRRLEGVVPVEGER